LLLLPPKKVESAVSAETIAKERLIIFTRYPEQGLTKTRLIPALGATQRFTAR